MMQRMATYKHVYPENLYDHLVTVLFGGPMVCSRCGSTAFFSFFVFVLFIFWYLAVILLTVGVVSFYNISILKMLRSDAEDWLDEFGLLICFHRLKSQTCSSSFAPKMLRLKAYRPNFWPEAAQPMTTQREVHADVSQTVILHRQFRDSVVNVYAHLSTWITCASANCTASQLFPPFAVYLTCSWLYAALCCRGGVYQTSDQQM